MLNKEQSVQVSDTTTAELGSVARRQLLNSVTV